MSLTLQAFLAFSPILLTMILLIGFKLAAKYTMPLVLMLTAWLAMEYWGMDSTYVMASVAEGLVITFDVLYIVFGALLLLTVLKYSGGLASIRYNFAKISPDRRIQIIVIAWLFGSFLEGASGFGTPAAIVAPLLLALGFPAMAAILIGLMVQSTAVTFGAIGTPILIGVNNGLVSGFVGLEEKAAFLQAVTARVAVIHTIVGTFMPWFMIAIAILVFGERKDWRKCVTIAPFAIFSGLSFTIPYLCTAVFLGPEFPSLLGAMIGLFIVVFAVKQKFLIPKDTWDFPPKLRWHSSWSGQVAVEKEKLTDENMSVYKAWAPYVLVSLLLVVTRLRDFGIGQYLKSLDFGWQSVFGTSITVSSSPLYLPGTMLIIGAVFAILIHRLPLSGFLKANKESLSTTLAAAFVLLFTIPMVRIYINSGINHNEMASMPVVLADWVAFKVGDFWPSVSPLVGALGAFIAGSNTVSNLMFVEFQYSIAEKLQLSTVTIVALQAVGAAAGNMIAIHNVVAASAVVGLIGKEGAILRKTIIPTLYYVLAAGLIGMLLA